MATFFDLVTRPNESIKSKTTGKFVELSNIPTDLKIPNDWDVKPGDILSWSNYRATETYFVTHESMLLKNPDTSGAGYLTIPLSITSLFPDAVNYFFPALNVIGRSYIASIELAPTDFFFISNFTKEPLPTSIINRNNLSYSFDLNEEVLYVTRLSNSNETQHFPLQATKTSDIIQWILSLDETKTKINVKFNFEDKEMCRKVPHGIITGLPAGWQCEQKDILMYSENKIQGEWLCEGPEKTNEDARRAIAHFYEGLNIEII
ncbi:unnamed protein product [Rotaria magnacalcarata]|uniref:Uncharacterized protein n=2 Tax=Rotaria magnacalcarata TaxID=392030 RepID=A0A816YUG2_9BILA|nr:unnamed protein product [Rotaria magnacalcarata]